MARIRAREPFGQIKILGGTRCRSHQTPVHIRHRFGAAVAASMLLSLNSPCWVNGPGCVRTNAMARTISSAKSICVPRLFLDRVECFEGRAACLSIRRLASVRVAIATEVVGHRVGDFQLVDLIGRDVRCAQHRHRHDPDFLMSVMLEYSPRFDPLGSGSGQHRLHPIPDGRRSFA